jgi:long-subunit acyl-CoA synthetase (AMP-forming)
MTGNSALQELFDACGATELVEDGVRFSATALHHGADDWARALRRAGVTRGDRIVCALPNGAALAQLVVSALAEGITLAPVPAHEDAAAFLDPLDARLAVALDATHRHVAVPSRNGGPPGGPIVARAAAARSDAIAFLLRSSGSTAEPRWSAVSERAVLSVLESHLPHLGMDGASTLSVLPWSHAFGLILGLLPALLRARRIVTFPTAARDASTIIRVAAENAVTQMHMVPLLAMRLAAREDGRALLSSLRAGLVGGAPIDAALASALCGSNLRVGYGQTEAGPGIMLGNPGEFSAGFIGRPVGCDVRIDADDVLAFRGANASDGYWEHGALQALDRERWHRTDDIVTVAEGAYTFLGRTSASFKLANGTAVDAPRIEASLRSQFPRITDVVLAAHGGGRIAVVYSTHDALPVDGSEIGRLLGGLRAYLHTSQCVGVDAWVRSPKGEIDRRQLPGVG